MTGYPQTYPHDGTDYRRTEKWFFHDGSDWKKARTVYKHDGTEWRRVFGKTATWKPLPGSNSIYGVPILFNGELFVFNSARNFSGDYDNTGYVAKYNGSSWDRIGSITKVFSLFEHGGSLYALSYIYPDSYLYVYDGSTFNLVETISNHSMYPGVSYSGTMAIARHDLVSDNLYKKFNGLWETYAFGTYWDGQPLNVYVAQIFNGTLYCDGERVNAPNMGKVSAWNGGAWVSLAQGTNLRFWGVHGGEILAGGNSGRVYSYSGGTWTQKGTLSGFASSYPYTGAFYQSRLCACKQYEIFALSGADWAQIGILYDGVNFHGVPQNLISYDGKLIVFFNYNTGAYFWDGDMP
jgi:hypothetical protein